jgi:hypothetical protein
MAEQVGSAIYELDLDSGKFESGMRNASGQFEEFNNQAKLAEQGSMMFAGALTAIGIAAGGVIIKAANTAARTETLGVAMDAVAKATGTSTQLLKEQEETLKKQGITTQEARTTLTRFMQSQLDVADASKVARVAQDLAVIAGENSSTTTAKLTDAIANQNVLMLRQFGIVASSTDIFNEYAATIGKTGSELTDAEKKQAFVNKILVEGQKVAGTYEASMDTVGKKMGSLARYFEEAFNAIGQQFLPIMGVAVDALTNVLKQITPENVEKALNFLKETFPIIAGMILGGLVPAFSALATTIMTTVLPAILALMPYIAVGALIGLGVKSIIDALGGWDKAMAKLTEAFNTFKNLLNIYIKPALDELWNAIAKNLAPALKQLWDLISPLLIPILKVLAAVIGGVVIVGLRLLIAVLTQIINIVSSVISSINWFLSVIRSIYGVISGALSGVYNALINPFRAAFEWIKNAVNSVVSKLKDLNPFTKHSPSLVEMVTKGVGVIKDQYMSLADITIPAPILPSYDVTGVSSVSGNNQNININIERVNDMQDVEAIGRELGFRASLQV